MKNIVQTIALIYGFIMACFFCYFMITGEIRAKKECIDEKGYVIGILWTCDSFSLYQNQTMRGRWWGYVYNSITWPSILFKE